MAQLDPIAHLKSSLELQTTRMVNDLHALPAETLGTSHAGCARSPLYIVAECSGVNRWFAAALLHPGTPRPSAEERDAYYASIDSTEKAIAELRSSVEELKAAYDGLDVNALGDQVEGMLNRPATLFAIASLPIGHMMYHDGQLNYLQTLHNDDTIHW